MRVAKFIKPLTVAFKEKEYNEIKNDSVRLQESMAEVVRMIVGEYYKKKISSDRMERGIK